MSESWKFIKQKLERVSSDSFTPINEVLSYGIDGSELHIHLEPVDSLSSAQKLLLFKEGLRDLAKIVEEQKEVEAITATSWIVAKHPKLLENLGFVIDGPIDQETRNKYFSNETEEISSAHVPRADFLKIYSV